MKVYKLKHVPTGLYYKPGEINLSTKGKIYLKKPGFITWLYKIECSRKQKEQFESEGKKFDYIIQPWEISILCKPEEFVLEEYDMTIQ